MPTARRTRETWEGLGVDAVPAEFIDAIYEAAPATLLEVARRAPDADTVILTTDSSIKPTINIPVYGQIVSAAPQPVPTPPKKSASDG